MNRSLAILAILAAAFAAHAAEPATPDRGFIPPGPKGLSRIAINNLIADLAEGDGATQQKAHEALASELADVIPRLELLLRESKDEQVKARAQAVLDDIRLRARFAPALVSLRMEGHPVAVLAEIFSQAHLPMITYPGTLVGEPSLKPVKVSFERRPFWEAVKEVCEVSKLDVRRVYDNQRLTVIAGENPPVHGPSIIHGPLILSAQVSGVSQPAGAPNRTAALQVYVTLEPRVRVVHATVNFTEMVDDAGIHLLALAPKANSPEVMFDAEFQWQANLPFNVPPASKSLARVRGELKLLVQLDSQTLEMPIKENGPAVRKKIAGYDVQIGKLVAKGDGGYQLSFDLSRGTLSDETWQWFRHPMGRVRLLDDAGRDLKVSDASSGGDEKTAQCGVGFHTSDGTTTEKSGPPARLVWEFPTKMREVSVPFEFVELPLPVAGN